jgi:hypothetical protein
VARPRSGCVSATCFIAASAFGHMSFIIAT